MSISAYFEKCLFDSRILYPFFARNSFAKSSPFWPIIILFIDSILAHFRDNIKSMKKITATLILFLFICFVGTSFAYEEVILNPVEKTTLTVPKANSIILEKEDCEDYIYQRKEEKSMYFEAEEEMFENKSGKMFSKFINEKVINNKLNRMYSDVESKFLDGEY
jgi:hypothetical protein